MAQSARLARAGPATAPAPEVARRRSNEDVGEGGNRHGRLGLHGRRRLRQPAAAAPPQRTATNWRRCGRSKPAGRQRPRARIGAPQGRQLVGHSWTTAVSRALAAIIWSTVAPVCTHQDLRVRRGWADHHAASAPRARCCRRRSSSKRGHAAHKRRALAISTDDQEVHRGPSQGASQ